MKTQESWAKTRMSELKLIIDAASRQWYVREGFGNFHIDGDKKDLSVLIKRVKM